MKSIISLMILSLLAAACPGGSQKLNPLGADAVVLAFGDSLTYGTGASPGESYPAVLQTLISRKVVNAGAPGETTAGGRARLAGFLDRVRPSLLLLCLGANDMLRGLNEEEAAKNLKAMISMARERRIQVVLIGVPRPTLLATQPEFYAEVAEELSVPYIETAMRDVLVDPALKADPIHPNARGYRKFAEEIARFLGKYGAL